MRFATGVVALFVAFAAQSLPVTNNDASCDISALPAATLLLPYFHFDLQSPESENTIFTITNAAPAPQIARVTLWTDRSYPVFSFDVPLSGYDVQTIDLHDVLMRGRVPSCDGFLRDIPSAILADMRSALTTGLVSACGTRRVGNVQADGRASGYATIDVVGDCGTTLPIDAEYFARDIRYENVLLGDYQRIDRANNVAQGGTMVHIRAIPEGGTTGSHLAAFNRTFYGRLHSGGTADRRQPLPSAFAARWISGGIGQFETNFHVWRDGTTGADAGCNVNANRDNPIVELVRFDEDENPTVFRPDVIFDPLPPGGVSLPSTSRVNVADTTVFPANPGGDVGGWMYMNLDGWLRESPMNFAGQAWVSVAMSVEGRYTTNFDATALGNGCTLGAPVTYEEGELPVIGPAPNDNARVGARETTMNNDDSCDIGVYPAATLLLPYFEVDLDTLTGATTLFTITNVSRLPQIAHVTIWSDWSMPLFDFNVFLTGYDVQSISLTDLLVRGEIAPPGTTSDARVGKRSTGNDDNPLLDLEGCDAIATRIPPSILEELRAALTTGISSHCGAATRIGGVHARAVGYVTIDLVGRCESAYPTEASYYDQLLYDNVLTGDYQQVDARNNFAQGGPMVHLRAIPEGGRRYQAATSFPRTFYGRYQLGATTDRRQPLPSAFAARWIDGGSNTLATSFKIWREGVAGTGCDVAANGQIVVRHLIRFDEDENAVTREGLATTLPSTSRALASSAIFPPNPGGDDAGWMYMDLHNEESEIASQNWVIVSMSTARRYSLDFDAPALGNGCSPVATVTSEDGSEPLIGPAANRNPIRPRPQ